MKKLKRNPFGILAVSILNETFMKTVNVNFHNERNFNASMNLAESGLVGKVILWTLSVGSLKTT